MRGRRHSEMLHIRAVKGGIISESDGFGSARGNLSGFYELLCHKHALLIYIGVDRYTALLLKGAA